MKVGDKVKPSYPVDNFTNGYVTRIVEHPKDPLFKNTRLIVAYWPDEGKEIAFAEKSLEVVE